MNKLMNEKKFTNLLNLKQQFTFQTVCYKY